MTDKRWLVDCPDCGLPGLRDPEKVPPTEFPEDLLAALHQWARAFDRYSGGQSTYSALDFMHWVIQNQRIHSHQPYRSLDVSSTRRSEGQTTRRAREMQMRTSAA